MEIYPEILEKLAADGTTASGSFETPPKPRHLSGLSQAAKQDPPFPFVFRGRHQQPRGPYAHCRVITSEWALGTTGHRKYPCSHRSLCCGCGRAPGMQVRGMAGGSSRGALAVKGLIAAGSTGA